MEQDNLEKEMIDEYIYSKPRLIMAFACILVLLGGAVTGLTWITMLIIDLFTK